MYLGDAIHIQGGWGGVRHGGQHEHHKPPAQAHTRPGHRQVGTSVMGYGGLKSVNLKGTHQKLGSTTYCKKCRQFWEFLDLVMVLLNC